VNLRILTKLSKELTELLGSSETRLKNTRREQGLINHKADQVKCLRPTRKMGSMKVKNEQKGAYGAQIDVNKAFFKF